MSRFGTLDTRYLDAAGDPLGGGKIYFYDPGTTTAKPTYSDVAQSVANPQPFVLDAGGAQATSIFFSGQAKAVLQDASGTQITSIDPIGAEVTDSGFADWSASQTYDLNDLVKGGDNLFYISVSNGNVNNNPTTPSPAFWMRIRFLDTWNSNYFYSTNDVVESGGILWISLSGSNKNNTPAFGGTANSKWRSLSSEFYCDNDIKTAAFTAVAGQHYLCNTNGGAFTITLPASPVLGDRMYFTDWAGTFLTNNLTLARNGNPIYGLTQDLSLNINRWSGALQYTGVIGWIFV